MLLYFLFVSIILKWTLIWQRYLISHFACFVPNHCFASRILHVSAIISQHHKAFIFLSLLHSMLVSRMLECSFILLWIFLVSHSTSVSKHSTLWNRITLSWQWNPAFKWFSSYLCNILFCFCCCWSWYFYNTNRWFSH